MHEKGMETFLAVAASRTFGKAAELLRVTQSTVSYNLNELENDVGMVLVERRKGMKSVKLTPAGEGFLPLALKWQEVRREIAAARAPGFACRIALGGSEAANAGLMPPVYGALLRNEPPVRPRIVTERTEALYQAVEAGALDAAVTAGECGGAGVQAEPVFQEGLAAAVIPGGEEPLGECAGSRSLARGLEFYIEWSGGYRIWHDHVWNPADTRRVEVDSVKLAAALMRRPGQWCVLPESALAQFAARCPRAVFRRLCETPPDIVYYKLTHRRPKASAAEALAVFDEALARRAAELKGKGAVKWI